jgi:hypothetical protein
MDNSNMYVNRNHPIVSPPSKPTSDVFYASISSNDRDVNRYPEAHTFTVDMPQTYLNVESILLNGSYFPRVVRDFTHEKNNIDVCFRFTSTSELNENATDIEKIIDIFMKEDIANNNYHRIRINEGRYEPIQLLTEVQNKMNKLMTDLICYRANGDKGVYCWGDYEYIGVTQHNIPFVFLGPGDSIIQTEDGTPVYFNTLYSSYNNAVDAFNSMYGTELPYYNPTTITVLPITDEELRNKLNPDISNPKTPCPLIAVKLFSSLSNTLPAITDELISDFVITQQYDFFKTIVDELKISSVICNTISNFEIIFDFDNYYSKDALSLIDTVRIRIYNLLYGGKPPVKYNYDCINNDNIKVNYVNWGLPIYLGFTSNNISKEYLWDINVPGNVNGSFLPTYAYNSINDTQYQPFQRRTSGGYTESTIYTLSSSYKINTEPEKYYYLEIEGINMIDELDTFRDNNYSLTNNVNSGLIKSVFAKLPIIELSKLQYRSNQEEEKTFTPPLRKLSRMSIKVRYHTGGRPYFGPGIFELEFKIKCTSPHVPNHNSLAPG